MKTEPNKCPDCGFELDYSDEEVITCWRCDAQEYKRMYDKEFAARMKLKADLATAKQGLEHYADVSANWESCEDYDHRGHYLGVGEDGDFLDGHIFAQQTLDAIGKE